MTTYLDQLREQLIRQVPFSLLAETAARNWFDTTKIIQLEPGQSLVSNRKLQDRIYLVIEGAVRLLVEQDGEIITLEKEAQVNFRLGLSVTCRSMRVG